MYMRLPVCGRGRSPSHFTGVTWLKKSGKWKAGIWDEDKSRCVDRFDDEIVAGKTWDANTRSLRGEATATNFNLDGKANLDGKSNPPQGGPAACCVTSLTPVRPEFAAFGPQGRGVQGQRQRQRQEHQQQQ
mgnify:CR=1 FL=1